MNYYSNYFGISTQPRTLNAQEFRQSAYQHAQTVLSHAKHWDLCWEDGKIPFLSYRHGRYLIKVPRNREGIGSWAIHLSNKTWIIAEAVYEFIHLSQATWITPANNPD